MNTRSIDSDIGFSDGEFESYRKSGEDLHVFVRAWNGRRIHITFYRAVRILDSDVGDIHDFCEIVTPSEFLADAIRCLYDVAPDAVPYRHFQLTGLEGPGLDIIAAAFVINIE